MQLFGKVVAAAGTRGNALVCVEAIGAGQPILRIAGPRVAEPGIYTIQCGETAHIHAEQSAWAFINHACEPNCAIDFATWELASLRPIRAGEEITYNDLSTEWDMASPFSCGCGAAHCPGTVRGFRYLNETQRDAIAPMLSPFLRRTTRRR